MRRHYLLMTCLWLSVSLGCDPQSEPEPQEPKPTKPPPVSPNDAGISTPLPSDSGLIVEPPPQDAGNHNTMMDGGNSETPITDSGSFGGHPVNDAGHTNTFDSGGTSTLLDAGETHSFDSGSASSSSDGGQTFILDAGNSFFDAGHHGSSDAGAPPTTQWSDTVNDLVFATRFSDESSITFTPDALKPVCYKYISGTDTDTGYDWETSIETDQPFGQVRFYYEGGAVSQRSSQVIVDPEDASNSVLRTRLTEPNVKKHPTGTNVCEQEPFLDSCNQSDTALKDKARIQLVFRENVNLKHFEYQVKMKLSEGFATLDQVGRTGHPDILNGQKTNVHWMTVGEFWNNLANEPNPFRITLGIHTHKNIGLQFVLKGDKRMPDPDDPSENIWVSVWDHDTPPNVGDWSDILHHEAVSTVQVPVDEWFTIHVAVTEGDAQTGRTVLSLVDATGALTPIIDVTGATVHPDVDVSSSDGFKDINPIKIYLSGSTLCNIRNVDEGLEILWDDFAIGGRQTLP